MNLKLEDYLRKATEVSQEHPVVVSKFMLNAREVEVVTIDQSKQTVVKHKNRVTLRVENGIVRPDLDKDVVAAGLKEAGSIRSSSMLSATTTPSVRSTIWTNVSPIMKRPS
jgi:hypothetical protein